MKVKVQLDQFYSIHDAVAHIKSMCRDYPEVPVKPKLTPNHDANEVKHYGKLLKEYETKMVYYKKIKDEVKEFNRDLYSALEEHVKEKSGLNTIVPEKKRDKVWNMAWEDGHSSGYGEVFSCLRKYVELFED